MKEARTLSNREIEVLRLAAEGHIDESIAKQLSIQLSTVRGYWLRIRAKWGMSSRSELVARFVREHVGHLHDARAEADDARRQEVYVRTDEAIAAERAYVDGLMSKCPKRDRKKLEDFRACTDATIHTGREAERVTRAMGDESASPR